jgi:hypothetical protein
MLLAWAEGASGDISAALAMPAEPGPWLGMAEVVPEPVRVHLHPGLLAAPPTDHLANPITRQISESARHIPGFQSKLPMETFYIYHARIDEGFSTTP